MVDTVQIFNSFLLFKSFVGTIFFVFFFKLPTMVKGARKTARSTATNQGTTKKGKTKKRIVKTAKHKLRKKNAPRFCPPLLPHRGKAVPSKGEGVLRHFPNAHRIPLLEEATLEYAQLPQEAVRYLGLVVHFLLEHPEIFEVNKGTFFGVPFRTNRSTVTFHCGPSAPLKYVGSSQPSSPAPPLLQTFVRFINTVSTKNFNSALVTLYYDDGDDKKVPLGFHRDDEKCIVGDDIVGITFVPDGVTTGPQRLNIRTYLPTSEGKRKTLTSLDLTHGQVYVMTGNKFQKHLTHGVMKPLKKRTAKKKKKTPAGEQPKQKVKPLSEMTISRVSITLRTVAVA